MSVHDDLRRLSSAEDFFAYLEVPYEKKIVDVARLHILRRMGEKMARDAADQGAAAGDDATARGRYRAHLEAAYADFLARSPIDERVFKVLKDAVKEKPKGRSRAFVPLTAIDAAPVAKAEPVAKKEA